MGFAEGFNAGSGAVTRGLEVGQRFHEIRLAKMREEREQAESKQRQQLNQTAIERAQRVNAAQGDLDQAERGGMPTYGLASGQAAVDQASGDAARENQRMGLQAPTGDAPVIRTPMRESQIARLRARVADADGRSGDAQSVSDRAHVLEYNEAKKDAQDEYDKDPEAAWKSVAARAGQLQSMGIPIAVPTEYDKNSLMAKNGMKGISLTDPATGQAHHLELGPQQRRELYSAFVAGSKVDPTLGANDIGGIDARLGQFAHTVNEANIGVTNTANSAATAVGGLLRGDAAEKRAEAFQNHYLAAERSGQARADAAELASYRTPPMQFKDPKGNTVVMERIAGRNPDGSIKLSWQPAQGMPDGLTPVQKGYNMEPDKWAQAKGDHIAKLTAGGTPYTQAAIAADTLYGKFHGDPNAQLNGGTAAPGSGLGADLTDANGKAAPPAATPKPRAMPPAPPSSAAQIAALQKSLQVDDQIKNGGFGGMGGRAIQLGAWPMGMGDRLDAEQQLRQLQGQ